MDYGSSAGSSLIEIAIEQEAVYLGVLDFCVKHRVEVLS